MNKVFLAFALLCITKVWGLACTNPLRSQFQFTSPPVAQVAQGISNCKSLRNVESCCTTTSFNSIQAKTDSMLNSLRAEVIARDKNLQDIRINYLPNIVNTLERLKAASKRLQDQAQEAGEQESIADAFDGISSIVDLIPKLRADIIKYQKARTVCVVQMVRLQAAAWCLACDGNYLSKGLSASGVLTLSTNACNRLVDACYDYFAGTQELTGLLELKLLGPLIESLTVAMEKFSVGDMSGVEDYIKVVDGLTNGSGPSSNAEMPSYVPASCTKESCPFICETLFSSSASVDLTVLANGGQFVPTARLLLQRDERIEEKPRVRILVQGQGWDFDNDEAGVTAPFEDDPGKITDFSTENNNGGTKNAQLIVSSAGCLVGLLMTIFI